MKPSTRAVAISEMNAHLDALRWADALEIATRWDVRDRSKVWRRLWSERCAQIVERAGRPGVGEPSAAAIAAAECAAFLLAHPSDADPATGIEYGGLS
jgi:hypothetical protein